MGFCLYSIRNMVNGKGYIGQTIKSPPSLRWDQHRMSVNNAEQQPLHKAIAKYGAENFKFEPMMIFDSQAELDRAEIYMIAACGTRTSSGGGYNVAPGGLGGGNGPCGEDTRRKISAAHKGRKLPPERRARMKAAMNRPEVKEKLSISATGRKPTAEVRSKMSASAAKTHTDEHNAAMRAAKSRPEAREIMRQSRLGRKHSEETKAKIAASHLGKKFTAEHRANLSASWDGRRKKKQ